MSDAPAYELVDTATGNWIGHHRTERDALAAVVEIADRWGEDAIANVALGRFAPGQGGEAIAEGLALLELARVSLARNGHRSRASRRSKAHAS